MGGGVVHLGFDVEALHILADGAAAAIGCLDGIRVLRVETR